MDRRLLIFTFARIALLAGSLVAAPLGAAEPSAAAPPADAESVRKIEFFEKNVRPVLIQHCGECHSAAARKIKGGLRLDTRAGVFNGGTSGPAIVPGEPDSSLLIKAIRRTDPELAMPPKNAMPAKAAEDLTRWVRDGAVWPEDAATGAPDSAAVPRISAPDHWAFKPIKPTPPPAVRDSNWPRTEIDRFILARLEAAGLHPSAPADKRTLIRRATFDLIGLPPAPAEVDAFLADDSPEAFARVVDRLLASPAYGERWGRHWLDLARYADTNGADENYAQPTAWRYRDYVVRSFNADKPYDRFIKEQLAGDLLPAASDAERADQLTATGFLVMGPKMLAEQDKPKLVMDVVDEQIDVVGQTFLGLTLGCARCHDHKFDPIPTADYYALAGIFKSTQTMANLGFVSQWLERPLPDAPPEIKARAAAWEAELTAARAEYEQFKKANPKAEAKQREAAKAKVTALEKKKPEAYTAMAVDEAKPVDVPVHVRGSHLTLAARPTPRGFVRVLDSALPRPAIDPAHSGRLELANWLTDPANPLTARVIVNRIWQGHFGVGLVATPSNFGLRGSPPTHPELLDRLANDFVRNGWSIKRLNRQIMLSAAYQSASTYDAAPAAIDPDNRLLWRQNGRRLEAEPIRDALLAVTGDLDRTIGGSLAPADGNKDKYSRINESDPVFRTKRRTLYFPIVRSRLHETFTIFDYTDAGVHMPRRSVTTVPQQALFMLNNDLVVQQADALAKKLLEGASSDEARIAEAHQILYSRPPTSEETRRSLTHLAGFAPPAGSASLADADPAARQRRAWASLCRVLLAANEFIFVQ